MREACNGNSVIIIDSIEVYAKAEFDGKLIKIFDSAGDSFTWDVAYCPFCGRKIDDEQPAIGE